MLLIQLKRFRNVLCGDKKLTKLVDYPISGLDLSNYTLGVKQDCVYDLFGVVHHKGFISGGHYIAFANRTPGSEEGEFVPFLSTQLCLRQPHIQFMSS